MTESMYAASSSHSRPGPGRWLDAVQMALQRLGFVAGARHVLVVPGQRTGIADSTLVMVRSVEGERYVTADLHPGKWVQDARAAGRGLLCRGRMDEHVSLTELTLQERIALLGHPEMSATVTRLHGGSLPADEIPNLAARITVFRLKRC
ncbi:MAG: deazaflavin-dependent nitroreductase [Chloroflexota bacterium]|nr:deazaflavin-dependent nitroreductase [Chloroflexota bacterium]